MSHLKFQFNPSAMLFRFLFLSLYIRLQAVLVRKQGDFSPYEERMASLRDEAETYSVTVGNEESEPT